MLIQKYKYDHWVLYICTPERTDYGYATSNVVATIIIIGGTSATDISEYTGRRNFGEITLFED